MKHTLIIFSVLALLTIAACGDATAKDIDSAANGTAANSDDIGAADIADSREAVGSVNDDGQAVTEEDCESRGGILIGCETESGRFCSMPTSDAGKPCEDSDDCEEQCVAPKGCSDGSPATGTCAAATGLVCRGVQTVEDGKCDAIMIA